jgi:hypothetical protein
VDGVFGMTARLSASSGWTWDIKSSYDSPEQGSSCEQSRLNALKEKQKEKEREWSMEGTTERLHAVDGTPEMFALASLMRLLAGKIST